MIYFTLMLISDASSALPGLIYQEHSDSISVPSFSVLKDLTYLEKLDLEGSQIKDAALCPLSSCHNLKHLSLQSGILTDESLLHFSAMENLVYLGVRDAVLTNAGLDSFSPPPKLRVLDLRGCWLLTEDAILLFVQKHSKVEVRHERISIFLSDKGGSSYPSSSEASSKTSQLKQRQKKYASPLGFGALKNSVSKQRPKMSASPSEYDRRTFIG